MASNTGWRNLAAIRVLLVGDGPYTDTDPARFGISFPTDGEGNAEAQVGGQAGGQGV
jgi:hypothetical protein